MKIFAYPIVFIVSLFLYFNSSSIIAYAIFVIATLGLLYYDIRLVEKFREKTTWKKVQYVFEFLISIFIVLIFISIVHVYPSLCTNGPNTFAKNYCTGEIKGFYCGITPWYYQKLRGQEAKDAEQKICNEYVTNDPLYQKIKSGNGTFDNSIYLGNVERISSNLGPLQEFHLRDTVFDTQPVGEVGVKDFGFAFVKTREGNFAKVKLSTYSVDNKGNTILTIFWAYQPNGTKSLKSDYTDFVRGLDTYCARYQ